MLPTFAVCFLATTALAACSARTRVHYVRADDRSRHSDPYYYPEREQFQSRASSIFGPSIQTSTAGFPYRFVFPANHPALSGSMYSQFVQNPHQPEPATFSDEDLFGPQPVAKQHPLSDLKHRQHQQQQQQQQQQQNQQQQQQIGYESMAKMQYDFLGGVGGGSGSGKIQAQQQPSATYHHHLIKQPKHYQSYELAPNALQQHLQQPLHQSPYPSTPAPIGQPIMLLIPSSGQPGAPYQTLVLVPSTGSPSPLPPPLPLFSSFHQQVQHQHGPPNQHFVQQPGGFITTHPRGPPLVAGFPSGLGGGGFGGGLGLAGESVPGLGKFPGAQLFHRSHETLPKHPNHQQHQHKASSSRPSLQPTSYQGSGSTHVSHTTAAGSSAQQPLEDKVGQSTGTSGEKSDERNDDGGGGGNGGNGSTETKSEENKSPEFGDKTTVKPLKRIVVT